MAGAVGGGVSERNGSTASRIWSGFPDTKWSAPSSTWNRAPATWSAMYLLSSTLNSASPLRCSTSVGTRTAGNTSRTSTREFMSISARTVDGVAEARIRCAHQRCMASSADGMRIRASASQSHRVTSALVYAARSSGVCAHG
jgi:hypothetical protein